MKNITNHTGTLEKIKRLNNSINGNPRYLVKIDGYVCRTAPDAIEAYSISNHFDKKITCNIGTFYNKAIIFNVKAKK